MARHLEWKRIIDAPRERVWAALTTVDGLKSWWTRQVTGAVLPGERVRLDFEGLETSIVLEAERCVSPSEVRWRCVSHSVLPEWRGTVLRFELESTSGAQSQLVFRHEGLTPSLACYAGCERGWDHFLGSLVDLVEQRGGCPFVAPAPLVLRSLQP